MANPFSIVIADVDAILAEYLSSFLERHGHDVLISTPTHAAVRDAVGRRRPDVCLLDLALRDGDNPQFVAELTAASPDTAVVVRTADTSSTTMQATLAAGAVGYVHKSRGPLLLLEVLARVCDGEVVVEGTFARSAPAVEEVAADVRRLIGFLTPRERECLAMLAEGMNTAAMANALAVSHTTIRTHVQSILTKLGVHSRLEAASFAARSGIVGTNTPATEPASRVVVRFAGKSRTSGTTRRAGHAGR
jgi:two-component system nitrate/nitrite response regulator NarL